MPTQLLAIPHFAPYHADHFAHVRNALLGAKSVQRLTDLTVKTLPPGTHWDTHTRGLGLRVGKQSRTFIVLVRSGERKTLGRYPYLSLQAARKECARIKAEAVLGKITPTRVSFDDAVADFLKECEERIRPRTLKNYRDYLRLLPFKRRALADLTPREIIQIFNAQSPSQREHLHRVGRTFFRWCVQQHLIERSPLENMRPVPTGRSRSRVLTPDELGAVYRTARAGTGHFAAIVALLCLTGQRRGEISRLEWEWIGPDTITIPAHVSKNGRLHTFPYGEGTAAVLASVPRLSERYVFPALRQRTPDTTVFNGFSKAKAKFDRESRVTDWTLHDLRRTYSSSMAALGVPQIVVEKLLNHVSGGTQSPIAQIYNRYQYLSEMREAVLTFERWLTTSLDGPRG